MIRVLIVTRVRLYREGLKQVLSQRPSLRIVGTSPDAAQALTDSRRLTPDVVLMDMAMPGAAAAVQQMGGMVEGPKVVGLAVSELEDEIISCIQAGISGYVPLDGSLDDLLTIIESVNRGEMICSPRIIAALARCVRTLAATTTPAARLTYREREVIDLIDRGWSNKQIAQQLHIAIATVKNHIHHVLKKLHAHRRGEVAALVRLQSVSLRPAEPAQLA